MLFVTAENVRLDIVFGLWPFFSFDRPEICEGGVLE